MAPAAKPEALELAERAYGLVQTDAGRARDLAEQALELARASRDRTAQAAALHALGWARADLGDPRALATMRAALRTAEQSGDTDRVALVRRNVAWHLAYRGHTAQALSEIEAARALIRGVDRARSEVFRIGIYHLADRAFEVLPDSTRALRTLLRRGDTAWAARLSHNRGVVFAEVGDHRAARRELTRANALYSSLGFEAAAADSRIELALLPALAGSPLESLVALDAIDPTSLTQYAASWLYLNRAEALIRLRLLPEGQADLARFENSVAQSGRRDQVDKARLEASRLALVAGDLDRAAAIATQAKRAFAARGQRAFASAAALVLLAVAVERHDVRPAALRSGRAAVDELSSSGWRIDALRGELLLARAATIRGGNESARRHIRKARRLDRTGTVADRVELRHVDALLLLRDGETSRSERRIRAGLDLLENYRAALGSLEVRATTGTFGVDLARTGLGIALASGHPERVLAWAERLRASALRFPVVRPPADPELRTAQAELRALSRRIREAEGRGRPASTLLARQADLEELIRGRSRLVRGDGASRAATSGVSAISRASGSLALVEYIELDGRHHALTLADQRLELRELGAIDVSTDLEWLRFALRRLARGDLNDAARTAMLASANEAAAALDDRLIGPLRDPLGSAPVVVVPTGPLHAVPWGALPSLRGRPLAVAPSLSTWLDLAQRPRQRRLKSTLVAGPGLRHARAEIRGLQELLPDATVLTGKEATVDATLAALDGATLAHVACHGRFRADSPLFSSLELADGPLTALDIQGLRRAPDMLVLSACDVALSKRHPGDELLGLSAALLASGTRTIVASVVPVPDAAARRLMLAFHRRLAAGASPAAALAEAQAGLRADRSALAGFLCLGIG